MVLPLVIEMSAVTLVIDEAWYHTFPTLEEDSRNKSLMMAQM